MLASIVSGHDVRMKQPGGYLHFPFEPSDEVLVRSKVAPAHSSVHSFKDRTHPAAADSLQQRVLAELQETGFLAPQNVRLVIGQPFPFVQQADHRCGVIRPLVFGKSVEEFGQFAIRKNAGLDKLSIDIVERVTLSRYGCFFRCDRRSGTTWRSDFGRRVQSGKVLARSPGRRRSVWPGGHDRHALIDNRPIGLRKPISVLTGVNGLPCFTTKVGLKSDQFGQQRFLRRLVRIVEFSQQQLDREPSLGIPLLFKPVAEFVDAKHDFVGQCIEATVHASASRLRRGLTQLPIDRATLSEIPDQVVSRKSILISAGGHY